MLTFPPSPIVLVLLSNLELNFLKGLDILLPSKLPQPIPIETSKLLLKNLFITKYSEPNRPVPPKSLMPRAS